MSHHWWMASLVPRLKITHIMQDNLWWNLYIFQMKENKETISNKGKERCESQEGDLTLPMLRLLSSKS